MRVKFIILMLAVAGIAAAQDCTSFLEIEANKAKALIYLDNKFIGQGKVRLQVPPGKYYITVKEDLTKWNEHEINDSVSIKLCNKEYLVSFNLFEKYFIDSKPQDAAVYIYDSLMAYTPNFISVNQYHTLNLKKGNVSKLVHSSELSKANLIPIDYLPAANNESFTASGWFKVLLGTAVVFGATAAYFKIEADKKYDDYLRTRDKKMLDEVDRLDLYSGIAFGMLQVNFGYLIYKFLFNDF